MVVHRNRRERFLSSVRDCPMGSFSAISPRPLTDAERARIEWAQRRIPVAEDVARQLVRRAVAQRDAEIAAAVRAGADQADIALVLGTTPEAIHDAVERTEEG